MRTIVALVVAVLLKLAIVIGVFYAGIHFILKWW